MRNAHGQARHRVGGDHPPVLDAVDIDERAAVDLALAVVRDGRGVGVLDRRRAGAFARGGGAVLASLAVRRERRLGAVVVVERIVIGPADRDQPVVRQPLAGRDLAHQARARRGDVGGAGAHRRGEQMLGLDDPAVLDLEPERQHHRLAVLQDHPHPAGLLQGHVRHMDAEGRGPAGRGLPQALARLHPLDVFDERHPGRERRLGWIMRDDRGEILVGDPDEAGAIAAPRARRPREAQERQAGRRHGQCRPHDLARHSVPLEAAGEARFRSRHAAG